MQLTDLEKQILNAIYEMDINNGEKPSFDDFELETKHNERFQEVGYYLEKFNRLELITYDENALTKGGRNNDKYHNNVLMIWWEKIHITKEGIKKLNK